jgi:hypothetical protein
MQTRNDRSPGNPPADEYGNLLLYRIAILGLDLCAIEAADRKTCDQIRQVCANCGFREACAADLKRDPNTPVWEAYCPNSTTLNSLATWWVVC